MHPTILKRDCRHGNGSITTGKHWYVWPFVPDLDTNQLCRDIIMLRPRQNYGYLQREFLTHFLVRKYCVLMQIGLKFVLSASNNNMPVLVQMIVWCRIGDIYYIWVSYLIILNLRRWSLTNHLPHFLQLADFEACKSMKIWAIQMG